MRSPKHQTEKPRDHASEPLDPHTRLNETKLRQVCAGKYVVSSFDRLSAAQYMRPKGVDDVVIGVPSTRDKCQVQMRGEWPLWTSGLE
jgi:hypothetical protein